ncbi:MAG: hypothetical protein ABIF10_08430 [Candidatus Woesearchaeota archaeon]
MKDGLQLHSLLNQLSMVVPDRDLYGMLVGYSVMHSLMNFATNTGSAEQAAFEEAKIVYKGLETSIAKCQQQSAYSTLCEFLYPVHEMMKEQSGRQSRLYCAAREVVQEKRGSYEDTLRRLGLELQREILAKGKFQGTKNILTEDYKSLQKCFGYGEKGGRK